VTVKSRRALFCLTQASSCPRERPQTSRRQSGRHLAAPITLTVSCPAQRNLDSRGPKESPRAPHNSIYRTRNRKREHRKHMTLHSYGHMSEGPLPQELFFPSRSKKPPMAFTPEHNGGISTMKRAPLRATQAILAQIRIPCFSNMAFLICDPRTQDKDPSDRVED
jgi:hypothetical protein